MNEGTEISLDGRVVSSTTRCFIARQPPPLGPGRRSLPCPLTHRSSCKSLNKTDKLANVEVGRGSRRFYAPVFLLSRPCQCHIQLAYNRQ